METLAQHAPTPPFPYLDCSGSTCWVFAEGHALAGVRAPGCLDLLVRPPRGRGGRGDPFLPAAYTLVVGAETQAGSWGNAMPEGGVSTRRTSPGTWDQFGDPTPSMLISLPSEEEGQRGAGPLLPVEVEGSPTLSVKGTTRSGNQISPSTCV